MRDKSYSPVNMNSTHTIPMGALDTNMSAFLLSAAKLNVCTSQQDIMEWHVVKCSKSMPKYTTESNKPWNRFCCIADKCPQMSSIGCNFIQL